MALLLLGLAAIGAAQLEDDGSPVVLVHPHGSEAHSALEAAATAYTARTGKPVEIRASGWGDLYGELTSNLSAGQGADIVTVGNTWASDLYEKGLLTPLTEEFEGWRRRRGNLGDITRDLVRHLDITYMFPAQGGQSGLPVWHVLPLNIDTRVFFYRKDLFRKYLRRSAGPITIEEAIQFGASISSQERASNGSAVQGFAVPGGGGSSEVAQVLASFVMGNGSSFIGTEESCTFESPEFQGALKSYTGLYGTQQWFYDNTSGEIADAFGRGEVVQMVGATWLYEALLHKLSEDQVGVSPLPAGPVGPFLFQGGSGWAIPSWVSPGKRARVWDFVEYFMEPQRTYMKDLVFGADLIPAYESVTRVSRLTVGDAVQLSELKLWDEHGAPISLTAAGAVLSNPGGVNAGAGPEQAAAEAGDWVDFNMSSLVVDFGTPTTVSGYGFLTGSVSYERDPVAWTFDGYDVGAGAWVELRAHDNEVIPLSRRVLTSRFELSVPAPSFSKYRFRTTKLRGSVCATVCQTVLDQLSFAVPLNYPQIGFFKMGRMEGNNTVERMVQRVYSGLSTEEAASLACTELSEVLWDPPVPASSKDQAIVAVIAVFSTLFVVVVAVAVAHRVFVMRTVMKLKNDNEMAEDLARAVAGMELDEVEYLHKLEKPNRIQSAFVLIVSMLKEYRSYMPASVLVEAAAEDDTEQDTGSDSGKRSVHTLSSLREVTAKFAVMELRLRDIALLVVNVRQTLQNPSWVQEHEKYIETVLVSCADYRGLPESFYGDTVFLSWNAARAVSEGHVQAAGCACALRSKVDNLSVGLGCGRQKVGNLGCNAMKKFNFVGALFPTVLLVEKLNKVYGTAVLSAGLGDGARQKLYTRLIDMVLVAKYSADPTTLLEVMDLKRVAEEEWMYQLEHGEANNPYKAYNTAVGLYFEGERGRAAELLSDVKDEQAERFLRSIEDCKAGGARTETTSLPFSCF